jgi:hypothetical protein
MTVSPIATPPAAPEEVRPRKLSKPKSSGRWILIVQGLLFAIVVGLISFLLSKVFDLHGDVEILKGQVKQFGELPKTIANHEDRIGALERRVGEINREYDLLHSLSWTVRGYNGGIVNGRGIYQSGGFVFPAILPRADSFVEAFCDLRGAALPVVAGDLDETFNLVGVKLSGSVRSSLQFAGEPDRPNGIQILVKDPTGKAYIGRWIPASSLMETPDGQPITLTVPDLDVAKRAAGLSVKFTIGTGSRHFYRGDLLLKSFVLRAS